MELALSPAPTSFPRYEEYSFDDPTRRYDTERQKIFEGVLDPTGKAQVSATVESEKEAPGRLRAPAPAHNSAMVSMPCSSV